MTMTDWTPDSKPNEEADPLSATGMFLSALGKESAQPQKQPEASVTQPVARPETKQATWPGEQGLASSSPSSPVAPANGGGSQGSAGEFTRLFQAAQAPGAPPPQGQWVQSPAPPIEAKPATASAPGEFTRIFVKPAESTPVDRPPAPSSRAIPEPAPASNPVSGASRMKGFSSGASDSASAEGSFTQIFQARPSTPAAPAPTPRVQAFTPPPPPPAAPAEEMKWSRQPDFSHVESSVDSGASGSSVTGLFASLGANGQRHE